MKFKLRSMAAALVVAMTTVTAAEAATFENTFVLQPYFGPGLTQYFSFFDAFDSGVAGDTFTDTFIFGSAPAYSLAKATIFSEFGFDGSTEVSFSSLILADAPPPPDYPLVKEPFSTSVGPSYIRGITTAPLASGSYFLQVSGTLLTSEAAYGGLMTDTVTATPVPEPGTAWLLALGLGAMGVAKRTFRRG